MARRRLLLGVLLAPVFVFSLFASSPASAAQSKCQAVDAVLGTCPTVSGEIVGGEVQLGANAGAPGSGNGSGGHNGGGAGNNGGGGGSLVTPPAPLWDPSLVGNRDDYVVSAPVTLSDLVNFRPNPGVDHMEPDGWMVVGLDTNFYARSSVQLHNGVLLGSPASVRFTPVRYHWTYGDGARASRNTPGTTWRAAGIPEFDRTPTSHVYTAAGTYYIDLTIDFSAEYRYGGGPWTPISGTIPVPANRLVAIAGGAKTVLVERECDRNPAGPGC